MHASLRKFLGTPEEINGDGRCATYLYRWTIAKFGRWGKVGIHQFVGDNWSFDFACSS
jgi:hypothetical protein